MTDLLPPFLTYFRPIYITSNTQQNYVDYHKCVNAKGEDFEPCTQFKKAFRALCPSTSLSLYHLFGLSLISDGWIATWDEQVDNGLFPASLQP